MAVRALDEAERLRLGILSPDPFVDADPVAVDEGRVPPNDLLAEQGVLGTVLVAGSKDLEHVKELEPEHFYSGGHMHVFAACRALEARGLEISIVAVHAELQSRGRLQQVGGKETLTDLATNYQLLSGKALRERADHLRRLWCVRQLIWTCQRVVSEGYVGAAFDALRGELEEKLGSLRAAAPDGQRRSRIMDATAIWAPRAPIEYAVAGILPRGSLAMICATGSSLKTWASVDLVISRAKGSRWLGRFDCEKGPSLFVDWESGEDELCRRIVRLSAEPVEGVALVTMPDVFFNSADFEAVVTEWTKTYTLIVFDSLAAGTIDVDENDARFAQGLRILKRIAATTGAVFVVLHHSRKGRNDGTNGGDERDMPRGTSANFAAVDVLLQLTRAEDGAFQVQQTKARGGKRVEPFVVRVDDLDERTTVVTASDVATAEERTETKAAETFDKVKAAVIRLVASVKDLQSATEIHRRLKGRKQTVFGAVKELEERGTIRKHEGVFRLSSEVAS